MQSAQDEWRGMRSGAESGVTSNEGQPMTKQPDIGAERDRITCKSNTSDTET